MAVLLHVLAGFSHGGTETLSLDIARSSKDRFHHVFIAVDPHRRDQIEAFRGAGTTLACELPKGRLRRALALAKMIRKVRPDYILVWGLGVDQVAVSFFAALTGARVVAAAGNPAPQNQGRWKWGAIVLMSRVTNTRIVACSSWVLSSLRRLGVGVPKGTCVIYNGCDTKRIAGSAMKTKAQTQSGPLRVGMVGRLDSIKDQSTLIRACAVLSNQLSLRLVIIGDGPLREELSALAEELQISKVVEFLGSRSDVPELLGTLDIFVFSTTENEGFGIALIEAMAAGIPVIASDVPACREILSAETACLVPPRDSLALADAILALHLDKARAQRLSAKAITVACTNYDSERCVQEWIETLERI